MLERIESGRGRGGLVGEGVVVEIGWRWWETYCIVNHPLDGHEDLERYRHVARVIDGSS